jgi:hypothetical protein
VAENDPTMTAASAKVLKRAMSLHFLLSCHSGLHLAMSQGSPSRPYRSGGFSAASAAR